MKVALCALLLAVCASAEPPEAGLFPADTAVVLGVRVGQLAPALRTYSASMPAAGAEWLKTVSSLGFDPLRDVEELLIASPASSQSAPALIVAHGAFGSVRIPDGQTYRGVPLVEVGTGSTFAFAILDSGTALAGTPAVVRAAIDRRNGASALNAPLAARVDALRGRYDIWGAGDRPGGLAPLTSSTQQLDSIDAFQFGMNTSDGLRIDAELHVRNPKDLEQFAQSVRQFETAMRTQQPQPNSARMELKQEGGSLKLSVAISAEELKQASLSRMAAMPGFAAIVGSAGGVGGPPVPRYNSSPGTKLLAPNGDTRIVTLPGAR